VGVGAKKLALVLGGAACVWDDVRAAKALAEEAGVSFSIVVAVNDIGIEEPDITHWVTLHPEKFGAWQAARAARGYPETYIAVAVDYAPRRAPGRVDRRSKDWGGSSGLYADKVALEDGASKVVLAGVPMTPTPHFFNNTPWKNFVSYQHAWRHWKNSYARQTRSMSGWTRELLGPPTVEWLGS
jgi:hypothetical protein